MGGVAPPVLSTAELSLTVAILERAGECPPAGRSLIAIEKA
jgi:hypothetical protein